MKKRVLGILGLAALTLVSMIAPANRVYAKEEENLKIGLSFVSLNFPYYVRMYDTFMEESVPGTLMQWKMFYNSVWTKIYRFL